MVLYSDGLSQSSFHHWGLFVTEFVKLLSKFSLEILGLGVDVLNQFNGDHSMGKIGFVIGELK